MSNPTLFEGNIDLDDDLSDDYDEEEDYTEEAPMTPKKQSISESQENATPLDPIPVSRERSRRRITNINPGVKIVDIARGSRNQDKKKKEINRRGIFKFDCEGDIVEKGKTDSKHVKWHAQFDRPIEELIYPSLQRFDNEKFEKKRKEYQKLHGHYESNVGVKGAVINNLQNEVSGIKLEMLPNMDSIDENIMFIHTPKWTVDITKSSPKTKKDSKILDDADIPLPMSSSNKKKLTNEDLLRESHPLLDEIEIEGEKYLRNRIKENHHLKVLEDQQLEQEREKMMNPFNVEPLFLNTRRNTKMKLPPISSDADMIYMKLVSRNIHNTGNIKKRTKLSEMTIEETSYNEQSKYIQSINKRESDHLLNGVFYYRVKNQIHQSYLEENTQVDQKKMTITSKKNHHRKFSNQYNIRLSLTKGLDGGQNVGEMHALRNEDSNMVTSANLADLPPPSELHFTRLARLNKTTNSGIDKLIEDAKQINSILSPIETSQKQEWGTRDSYISAETKKREAQDLLLLNQLESGVLPESFIKPGTNPLAININLSKYSIGDTRGMCLGKCIKGLDRLESLGLSDNRLTAMSLPTIIENVTYKTLIYLDLSFNKMHDQGAKAIANHFRMTGNVLRILDLSNSGLKCSDIKLLCDNLKVYPNSLEELLIAGNKIASEGATDLCKYLSSKTCILRVLDISWNTIGEVGAFEFSTAFRYNKSLIKLNIAANGLNDHGGQRFIDSLSEHHLVQEINMAQNGIADSTCFVVAQVLCNHPSMKKLDLSFNPLGEAGARSIFRMILKGLKCFITMRNCSYKEFDHIFNYTYPSAANPYHLDLSEPYKRAILQDMIAKFRDDPIHCNFESMHYRENNKAPESTMALIANNKNQVCLKSTGEVWEVPKAGIIRFSFNQEVFVPSFDNRIDEKALNILQIIIENGITEADKKQWLALLCQDIYFDTVQAQYIIDRFKKNRTIGAGGLSVLDVLKSLWKFLIDTENMFDFLYANTDSSTRKDLVFALTLKRYKFNWVNPTSHWRLNLGDKKERGLFMQILAINNFESEFSKNSSGRGDTSQSGNWYNFRNEKYSIDNEAKEMSIDKEFIRNPPANGYIEFDYVSTTRPPSDLLQYSLDENEQENNFYEDIGKSKSSDGLTSRSKGGLTPQSMAKRRRVMLVTDEEFYAFLNKLGLSSRSKISSEGKVVLYVLMDLQLASTKYYFLTKHLPILLDTFPDDWDIQSRVIVIMFSRIYDIYNMDTILRNLDSRIQQDVIIKLGCLNLINPLKISYDYILCLKYFDNRKLLVDLMELASVESADQIHEDPTTELPITAMYGSYTRALNDSRPETMKFTYCDFGVRTNNVMWSHRRELVKKFLVGTQPIPEDIYNVITMFKELEASNSLTRGPIDLQYANFKKAQKTNMARTTKATRSMISLMKNVAANISNKKGGANPGTPKNPSSEALASQDIQ